MMQPHELDAFTKVVKMALNPEARAARMELTDDIGIEVTECGSHGPSDSSVRFTAILYQTHKGLTAKNRARSRRIAIARLYDLIFSHKRIQGNRVTMETDEDILIEFDFITYDLPK